MKTFKKLVLLCCASIFLFAGCSVIHNEKDGSLQNYNASVSRSVLEQSSDDYQKDVIYFLFVDRFSDGDSTNNAGLNPAQYDSTKTNWKKYWGGDLQGVNNKLDYLKNLGINSIWVTPLVEAIDTPTNAGDSPYHGYWGKNYFNIDEHWGTWNDFDNLVSKMHSSPYNMKLILDYAPNHSNPNDEAEYGSLYKTNYNTSGEIISTDKLTDYLTDTSGSWYHRLGGIGDTEWDDPYYCRYKNLFNLSDFNQDNSATYSYLADALEFWLNRGVDGVRLDAVKHMNTSFTTSLVSDMKTRTGRDIFFFGEWMDAGAWATGLNTEGQYFANNSGCSLLDFGYRSTIESVLKNSATMRTLAAYLSNRESYWSNPLKQVVFLDNHDMPRINTVLRNSAGMSESYAAARTDLGLAITMTIRGVPCIYYGTEQYSANFTSNSFGQTGSDPYNREMMPSFNTETNACNIIRSLANLRQTNKALQNGTYSEKWVDDTLLAYERKSGTDAVVVVANKGAYRVQSVSNLSLPDGVYTDVLGGDSVTVTGGTASFELSENEVVILATTSALNEMTVYFYNNSITNWSAVNCYYWNLNGQTSTPVAWPGSSMQSDSDGWYSFTIPNAANASLIFNNSGSSQTVDLSRTGNGWFVPSGFENGKITGTWYDTNPYSASSGTLNITFKAGSSSENVSFPGDANGWSLTENVVSVGSGETKTLSVNNCINSSSIALGDDSSKLELKIVTNSNWDNQWSFGSWSKSENITLTDNNRQIAITCMPGDSVNLTIDVSALSLSAGVIASN